MQTLRFRTPARGALTHAAKIATLRRLGVALAARVAFVAPVGEARAADTVLAVDLDGAVVLGGRRDLVTSGAGFAGRLGWQLHAPLLRITPEVGYGFLHLAAADRAPADWSTHRLFAGARLGIGELVVPTAFALVRHGDDDVVGAAVDHRRPARGARLLERRPGRYCSAGRCPVLERGPP